MTRYDTKLSAWYHNYVPERFPTISKPTVIGFYSLDGERCYNSSAANLKYLRLPVDSKNVLFDLNQGYDNVIHKPETSTTEGIAHLLEFIVENKQKLSQEEDNRRYLKCDFVCFRGLLRLIMCSPYETKEDWCIMATKFKGNIYLCQKETEQKRNENAQQTEQSKKLCSYGFKFEQYILSDDPKKDPDTKQPVNESEEFTCVFKSCVEGIEILYGAEMDGIVSDELCDISSIDPNTLDFIEVKTRRKETNVHQRRNYLRFNLRKWWCQSFLVGINRIYVGLRNDAGFVQEINVVDMKTIPKMAKEFWSPAVCVDFLKEFLDMVRNVTKQTNCPHTVFEFYWDPKTQRKINYKYYQGKNDLSFLPEWYVSSLSTTSHRID